MVNLSHTQAGDFPTIGKPCRTLAAHFPNSGKPCRTHAGGFPELGKPVAYLQDTFPYPGTVAADKKLKFSSIYRGFKEQ
jgi:hypothetical protein